MAQYIVRAKNPEYNGKTVGVRFNNGEAFVNDYTIDKKLGKDLAQVIAELGELGYVIQEVPGEAARVATEFKMADDPSKSAFPVTDDVRKRAAVERTESMPKAPAVNQVPVESDLALEEAKYKASLISPVPAPHGLRQIDPERLAGSIVQEQVDPDPIPYVDPETNEVVTPAAEKGKEKPAAKETPKATRKTSEASKAKK